MKTAKIFIGIFLIGILSLAVSFVVTRKSIEKSLIEICDSASEKYDCLPRKALLLQLSDSNTSTTQMNETIWAIGKMKINKALPKLEVMLHSCDNPGYRYNRCKYELEKTIRYLKNDKIDLMAFKELNK